MATDAHLHVIVDVKSDFVRPAGSTKGVHIGALFTGENTIHKFKGEYRESLPSIQGDMLVLQLALIHHLRPVPKRRSQFYKLLRPWD